MSTATEISRITDARNTIRDKLIELGMATSTSKLDALATAIDGITNRGAVSATVQEGDTYTIPAGYHNGSGTVSGVSGGGNYTLQSKTVTPTKNTQSVTPDSGYYGIDSVTVNPIPEAYQNVSAVNAGAADVLAGKMEIPSLVQCRISGRFPKYLTQQAIISLIQSLQENIAEQVQSALFWKKKQLLRVHHRRMLLRQVERCFQKLQLMLFLQITETRQETRRQRLIWWQG